MTEGSGDISPEAMDRMMRTRGPVGVARDSVMEAGATERDYETALGQTFNNEDTALASGMVPRGDASPGTMEQGGVSRPVASPFHSERVQTEVELLRRRPPTLDQDAQRVGVPVEDVGLGEEFSGLRSREPPYERELSSGAVPVRVARMEHSAEVLQRANEGGNTVSTAEGGVRPGTLAAVVSEVALAAQPTTPQGATTLAAQPTTPQGATTAAGDALSERSRLSVAGSATRPGESVLGRGNLSDRPSPGDTRELVPALGIGTGSTEALLIQALQENQLLKLRIEQMESQSSWHSGRTPTTPLENEQIPQGSPVSLVHQHVSAQPGQSISGPQVGQVVPFTEFGASPLGGMNSVQSGNPSANAVPASVVQFAEQAAHARVSDQGQGLFGSMVGGNLYGNRYGVMDSQRGLERHLSDVRASERMFQDRMGEVPMRPQEVPPIPIASPPPAPCYPSTPNVPIISISKAIPGVSGNMRYQEVTGPRSVGSGDFQTPRDSSTGKWGLSADGYPVSPGGTIIKPPPLSVPSVVMPALEGVGPPTVTTMAQYTPSQGDPSSKVDGKPEEPAKYINEIPKLPSLDISTSAVACGNWLAQLRQIFAGLSPTAVVWWQAVEMAANRHYQRWLIADPLDRLSLDPSGVVAIFDEGRFQRVESRAVSLILAAIPQHLRDEAVSNRWLSSAALLFRLQCVYQPGGASERSMLLSQLTLPETVTTVKSAVVMLRKWQQSFYRVRELGASMPGWNRQSHNVAVRTAPLFGVQGQRL